MADRPMLGRDLSAESYAEAERSGRAEAQRRVVAEALAHGPLTARELSARLELDLQSVTPRVGELKRLGVVEASGSVVSSETGRRVQRVALTPLGVAWLRGEVVPRRRASRAQLKADVVEAAVAFVDAPSSMGARARLARAVAALRGGGSTGSSASAAAPE